MNEIMDGVPRCSSVCSVMSWYTENGKKEKGEGLVQRLIIGGKGIAG